MFFMLSIHISKVINYPDFSGENRRFPLPLPFIFHKFYIFIIFLF